MSDEVKVDSTVDLLVNMENYFDDGFKEFTTNNYTGPSDNERWTGKVVNNMDPSFLGRVQIMIFGKYDDMPTNTLPWAVPDIKYLGSGNGNFIVPPLFTIVRGYFEHGDIHKPIYDSVAFNYEHQLKSPTLLDRKIGYPNTMVLMETEYGDYVTMNRLTADTKVQLHNGVSININAKGDISITTLTGNLDINVMAGNTTLTTTGNTSIKSAGIVEVDGATVNLGKNPVKQLVNNLPVCPISGLPHCTGNTNVFA